MVVLAAVAVAFVLSYFGVRTAVAERSSERADAPGLQSAVRLEQGNPDYWYRLGHFQQFNLEEADPSQAEEFFLRAIFIYPNHTDAWLDLATSYELDGKKEKARDAFNHAKQSYPGSAEVSWRYGNFLLRDGELTAAYAELRHAVELDPRRAPSAFSRCYRANADIDAILNDVLPAESSAYISVVEEAVSSRQFSVAQIVWKRLLTLRPHLIVRDFALLVNGLMAEGEFVEARRVWEEGVATMNLPPLYRPQGSVIWDPSFESEIKNVPFAWQYQPLTQGTQILLDSSEKLTGALSLRLSFDGKQNPGLEAACTLVLVDPGKSYRLSGWVKTQDLTTDRGIDFHIHPIGPANQPVVETRDIRGSSAWTFVDLPWTVPRDVHRAAVCVARDPSDTVGVHVSGMAWVDDVVLIPQGPETHKP